MKVKIIGGKHAGQVYNIEYKTMLIRIPEYNNNTSVFNANPVDEELPCTTYQIYELFGSCIACPVDWEMEQVISELVKEYKS